MKKQYEVIIGLEFFDGKDLIQHACLLRDGQTIGTRSYKNGHCYDNQIIDSADTSLKVYFVTEASDVTRNSPLAKS